MELRKDVKYMLNCDWEPKIPEEEVILKHAKTMLKKGKSSGKVTLDIKAMNDGKGQKFLSSNEHQVKNTEKRKNYVIKFQKIPSNISFSGNTTWEETLSSTIQKVILDYVSKRNDILITKMVIKPAHSVSYIKFKATISGYKYMFSFFTRPEVETELELISQFKI